MTLIILSSILLFSFPFLLLFLFSFFPKDRYGITANALAPSARTRMTEQAFAEKMATEGQAFDVMDPANIAPAVVWLGSAESREVTGCVFELEGGKIMIEDGWREGPAIDKGARWEPAEVGDAVERLLAERAAPRKVWGS